MSTGNRQLVDVISALRSDIEAAIVEGEGKKVKFDLEDIEVDLKVSITNGETDKEGGKAGVNILGFVNFEYGGDKSKQASEEFAHTIKLRLTPKVKNPKTGEYEKPKNISGRD